MKLDADSLLAGHSVTAYTAGKALLCEGRETCTRVVTAALARAREVG